MANLKLIYPSGATTQITYNAVKNFDYGQVVSYLETDDHARAMDGTLNSYAGPRKKTFDLTFSYVLKAQFDFFLILWTFQCPIDLYLDGVNLDATVKMMSPPSGKSEDVFVNDESTCSFDVRFEEV